MPATRMPPPSFFARAGNVASTGVRQKSDKYGTFERNGRSFASDGAMWSVVMLSSIFSSTLPEMASASGLPNGKG